MKNLTMIMIIATAFTLIIGCGDSSDSGNTGDTGDTGNTGNSGDTGDSGDTGNTGDTSDSGNTGNTGITCSDEGISPENRKISVPLSLEKVSWTACTDSNGSTLTYDVYIKNDFDGNDEYTKIASDISETEAALTEELTLGTTYWWYFVAKNSNGEEKSMEAYTWWFKTENVSSTAPTCEGEIDPADGREQVPVDTKLTWESCVSKTDASIKYDVYLCDKGETCYADTSNYEKIAADISETEVTPDELTPATLYYWYIIAKDENGEKSTLTSKWHFTTVTPGSHLWSFSVNDSGEISKHAASTDGVSYIGTYEGNVYAINKDGTEKWKYEFNDSYPINELNHHIENVTVGPDGTVYTFYTNNASYYDNNSVLVAINPENALEKWAVVSRYHVIESAPLITSDGIINLIVKVYEDPDTGSNGYHLVGVDPSNGTEEYRYNHWVDNTSTRVDALNFNSSRIRSIAASQDGTIYFPTKHIYEANNTKYLSNTKLDYTAVKDGTEEWIHHFTGDDDSTDLQNTGMTHMLITAVSIDTNGDIYSIGGTSKDESINDGKNSVHKISKVDGTVLWKWKPDLGYSEVKSKGVVIDKNGTVYVMADTSLYAINGSTGQTAWSMQNVIPECDTSNSSIAVLDDGNILVTASGTTSNGSNESNALLINSSSQEIIWDYNTNVGGNRSVSGKHLNVFDDGIVVFVTSNGGNYTLDAYDFSANGGLQTDAPWPIALQNPQRTSAQ